MSQSPPHPAYCRFECVGYKLSTINFSIGYQFTNLSNDSKVVKSANKDLYDDIY